MKTLTVAAATLNLTALDWDTNQNTVSAAISAAKAASVDILCLPELCVTGYNNEDVFLSPSIYQQAQATLESILPLTSGIVVTLGLPVIHSGQRYNAVCLVVDGVIAGAVAKRYLADDGIHYEARWFSPWPVGERDVATICGRVVPFGDIVFDIGGIGAGIEICHEMWVHDRPLRSLVERGASIILNPSASHFEFGKNSKRRVLLLDAVKNYDVAYLYANYDGNQSGRALYDGAAMIASGGQIIASGTRFNYGEFQLLTAAMPVPRLSPNAKPDVRVAHQWKNSARPASVATPAVPDWERSGCLNAQEFARAVPLGLFDYMRKSRSRGFVISLSGGADSAACAVLVRRMVEDAVAALGLDGFKKALSYFKDIQPLTTVESIMKPMLLCVYQATRNSSQITFDAAQSVADAVGATFIRFDVDSLVSGYTKMVESGIGRALAWETDDVALQNIQARVRAPGVWMLANVRGALLIATSNRSEAAVGYATMDGDTAGGLSPIAGIDKPFLRRWLIQMERGELCGIPAIPALAKVNNQQPTAELRPSGSAQTDESDLMPYDALEAIEDSIIGERKSLSETFAILRSKFPMVDDATRIVWIKKFCRLWAINQWKRERYAPSFHIDDRNLDPKTWCRFPILSGGFSRELRDMEADARER